MASHEISTVNRSELVEVHDLGEDEDEEGDDDDDEDNTVATTSYQTNLGKADIQNCQETHLGNRSEYHGSVNVKNVYKLTVPAQAVSSALQQSAINTGNQLGLAFAFSPDPGSCVLPEDNNLPQISEIAINDVDLNTEIIASGTSDSDQTPLLEERLTNTQKTYFQSLWESFCSGFVGLLLGMMTLSFLAVLAYVLIKFTSNADDDDPLPGNFTDRLITRGEWFAQPPKRDIQPFKYKPIPFVVICHTAGSTCNDRHSCRVIVRNIQAGHLREQFDDIAYNYLVGGDGYIYEGRGWNHASADTVGMGCSSLSVAFIGNFLLDEPPLKQIDALKLILEQGTSNGTLNENYKMFMQKQIISTESPGEALIEILIKWPHWKPFSKNDLVCQQNSTVP